MKRAECLASIVDLLKNVPCFVTVGRTWTEWEALRSNAGNFQVKTLGSGSSHGLGLALAMPHRKIAILDGDGAVTMNLNGLLTIGRKRPKNLVHIVFDNKMYESSGAVATETAHNADLVTLALGSGIKSACRVGTVERFKAAAAAAMGSDGPHFIVADVETAGPATAPAYPGEEDVEIKFRFTRFLDALEGRKLWEDAVAVRQSLQR